MKTIGRVVATGLLVGAVAALSLLAIPRTAWAVEVGDAAPEFTLASTTGRDIALKDYRGKKYVLLEFYGADFAPT